MMMMMMSRRTLKVPSVTDVGRTRSICLSPVRLAVRRVSAWASLSSARAARGLGLRFDLSLLPSLQHLC